MEIYLTTTEVGNLIINSSRTSVIVNDAATTRVGATIRHSCGPMLVPDIIWPNSIEWDIMTDEEKTEFVLENLLFVMKSEEVG